MAHGGYTKARKQKAQPCELGQVFVFSGGGSRIRTCDLLIKSQLLYQLSYTPKTNPAGLWGTKHNNALATTCNAGIVRQTRQTVSTVLGN